MFTSASSSTVLQRTTDSALARLFLPSLVLLANTRGLRRSVDCLSPALVACVDLALPRRLEMNTPGFCFLLFCCFLRVIFSSASVNQRDTAMIQHHIRAADRSPERRESVPGSDITEPCSLTIRHSSHLLAHDTGPREGRLEPAQMSFTVCHNRSQLSPNILSLVL